ncbi:kinase-like domain-containing protein [Aspergillus filifer]
MSSSTPCSACTWTADRQENCRYHSNVKLFYSMSDRGVWSLGSRYILKDRSIQPPNFETSNLRFLKEHTSIPIPTVVCSWEEDGRAFVFMERVPGKPLSAIWNNVSEVEKNSIAKQTAGYLIQLRKLHSSTIQGLNNQPIYSASLFPTGYGLPHEMKQALEGVPEDICLRLREHMPSAAPYTFTHGDLTSVNVMIDNGRVTGILDWESSGYFPVWWEFTCAGIGLGNEDKEWKNLLQLNMPDHTNAREFRLDFYALSKYPNLNERGMELLKSTN